MVMRPKYLKFELRTHFVVPFCKYFLVNIFMSSDILIPLGKSFKNELLPKGNGRQNKQSLQIVNLDL